jgi:trigger factor
LVEPLIISTSKRDDHQLDMSIQLGPERTDDALHRAAQQVSKRAKIPGFRPGKAPYATVVRMFGRDALLAQIMDEMGDEIYKEALEVEHIEPYGRADLEDLKTDPVTFKLVVPLQPEVHLGDYRSIRVAAPEVSVTDQDIDAVLERAAEQRATVQAAERAAELGDTVIVDIRGTSGEDTIMDNHDWEVALQGGDTGWLPGFDDAFVGMAAGDEKTFTLTYPEDSSSRYRGREATFQAVVKQVKAKVRPQMDDEFARSLGDYSDLAALRAEKSTGSAPPTPKRSSTQRRSRHWSSRQLSPTLLRPWTIRSMTCSASSRRASLRSATSCRTSCVCKARPWRATMRSCGQPPSAG